MMFPLAFKTVSYPAAISLHDLMNKIHYEIFLKKLARSISNLYQKKTF